MASPYVLEAVRVKNFRSIGDLTVQFRPGSLTTICGPNNVGKTNFIRALDLFFSLDLDRFQPEVDIPYHIAKGSRGAGFKTTIRGTFRSTETGRRCVVQATFSEEKGAKTLETTLNARPVLDTFRFFFVGSSNFDMPAAILKMFVDDALVDLDRRRGTATGALEHLRQFIGESRGLVQTIETAVTNQFRCFAAEVPGLDAGNWSIAITFPEFDRIREAISGMAGITLKDTNDRALETKGSGVQRIVLLALMRHIAASSPKTCVWGIDEPEAFLQPGLQKAVFRELRQMGATTPVILCTHSPHFVNTDDADHTLLFGATSEPKEYARRPGVRYLKVDTCVDNRQGAEKIEAIARHFGVERNDGWYVMPRNVIVEGKEDVDYITSLAKRLGVQVPGFFVAGGVEKIPGYLAYMVDRSQGATFRPKIICLLDSDGPGRDVAQRLRPRPAQAYDLDVKTVYRYDGEEQGNPEIEDLIYPELLYRGLNAFLRRKGYKPIIAEQKRARTTPAYRNTCVLQFLTEMVAARNDDQARLDFEEIGLKRALCDETCKAIGDAQEAEIIAWDNQFPAVRRLLVSLGE